MKMRIIALLSGLGILLGLSSCFQVEQLLTLKKDGSGTFVEQMLMSPQMVAMMGAQEGGDDPMAEMLDEKQYKEKAASYGEGVTFVKVEKAENKGWQGAKVTYSFKDINKFKLSPGSAMDDLAPAEEGGEQEVAEEPVTFSYKGGELVMNFPEPPKGEGDDADADGEGDGDGDGEGEGEDGGLDAQAEAMMKAAFAEMKMTTQIKFESGIASTNATHREGDTITIMEMNFGEIIANPEGMAVLQKMEGMDRKETEKALEGMKGVKVETKEKVTVKLK